MNLFVSDPHWGWWIVWYFFLGGIAAGAYFLSTLIELVGRPEDKGLARIGYRIAFPVIALCGVFLIVDLQYPARFWHMLFHADVVHQALDAGWPWSAEGWRLMVSAPLIKSGSPMSVGSWAIALFGLCSFLSFVSSFRPEGRVARLLSGRWVGTTIRLVGCAVGLFVAAYTGALLTATNQPLWSDSVWIASLFLTSSASTGIATLLLLGRRGESVSAETLGRLERADLWALSLELVVFVVFLGSLGSLLEPVLQSLNGKILLIGALGIGLIVPLAVHLRLGVAGRRAAATAALCVLIGGFLLRFAILTTPGELLARRSAISSANTALSDHERPAKPEQQPQNVRPRSKLFGE